MPRKTTRRQQDTGPLISRIEIQKLFYTYSYTLRLPPKPAPESGRLMLLYGNNGSGKTTILNLLYHLLHPEAYGGHRSFVGTIPFKLFRVQVLGGIIVSASRSRTCDPGGYDVRVEYPHGKTGLRWKWRPDKNRRERGEDPKYSAFCSFLKELDLSFHYLHDTRRVEGSQVDRAPTFARRIQEMPDETVLFERGEGEQEIQSPERLLITSVETAIQWFRQHALSATNVGYTSVNTIYRDLTKRIVTARRSQAEAHSASPGELIRELLRLREKNSAFARFGLTPELDVQDIVNSLEAARHENVPMLSTVLGPYLEGHAARLDALDELRNVMNSFVSLLSGFYSHKNVSVHLEKGLRIVSDTGQELEPVKLSSGEKQLLLLFCNAISSRQDRTILMIDEPEISLNVRWQRELIPALLTCMSGTAFQLILATHSVELLSRYREYVTPLDDAQGGKEK
jgi:energy-coupling factor transporter ATP-binding protein EcfA2